MAFQPKLGTPANLFWIGATCFAALTWSFGPQVLNWHEAKKLGNADPCLFEIPQTISIDPASSSPGAKLSAFGWEFEVPWSNPVMSKNSLRYLASFTFTEEKGLIFFNPSEERGFIALLEANQDHGDVRPGISQAFGVDAARSDLSFLRHILNVTPAQISPWLSKRESRQRMSLLRMKSVECMKKVSGFHDYEWHGLQCIQKGAPSQDSAIEVQCYDNSGGNEIHFVFTSRSGAGAPLSQQDIIRVVGTLHSVTPTSQNPAASKMPNR